MSHNLTMTDLFCGAGGSSTGAMMIPGVTVRVASNHWQAAVDVHNANHEQADHICADISQINPHLFPSTDLLWASPECTNHSQAKGKKRITELEPGLPDEAAERSRATMWDVVRFTEVHQYQAIVVENVVDVRHWLPFLSWLGAMNSLGYEHHLIYLNSMHAQAYGAPAPQSRDRVYVVFWRSGNARPDFENMQRPRAYCQRCDEIVDAVQSWKNPDKTSGRYRQQYLYRCPKSTCRAIVEPGWLPAASAIDWSLLGKRIGDREKDLAPKTRARVAAGIARYWGPLQIEAAGNTYDATNPRHPSYGLPNAYYRVRPVDQVMTTLHTSDSKGLVVPVEGREGKSAQSTDDALRTLTTRAETGLVVPAGGSWSEEARPTSDPHRTLQTRDAYAVVTPFIAELRGGGSKARSVDDPMSTVTASGNHHGLVTPYYGTAAGCKSTDDPIGTLTATDRYALIMRNNGGGAEMSTPASEVMRTLTTAGHQSLLTPGDLKAAEAKVDDCLFRMLEPSEVAAGMAFPTDYIWIGTRRVRVRMAGNAVTPPAARDILACVAESITGEAAA